MKNDNLKSRAISGMIWKFAEKIGTQGIQFIVQIVLARLLLPEDYGLVGLLTIFITICDVFVLQGFTTALIQKKDADKIDFSSVFYANIIMSALLYIILFFSAPLIAAFYNEPQLVSITRVLSLNVFLGAFSAVHNAIMSRSLEFKKSFIRGLSNVLTYGVVGLVLALLNFGAWSLVYAKLAGVFVGGITLWITVKWLPTFDFSLQRIKKLFRFSSKILGTNLLNTIFNNIHSLIIGKFYNQADLGYYQRGQQIPQTIMTAVDGSLNEVMYPTLSILQNDLVALKSALRRSIRTSMYLVLPILFGLLVTAEPLTLVLLTEKWLPSVPYMQLACVVCMFWPLSARTHALNAIGNSGLTFKLSLVSKAITLALILACVKFGIYAIMLGTIFASCITFFITSYFVKKYINYSFKETLYDIVPSLILSLSMAFVVYLVRLASLHHLFCLFIQIFIGVFFYISFSLIFKIDSLNYIISFLKKLTNKS